MLQKHPIKNPLWGLVFGGNIFLHKYRPYGTKEGVEVIKKRGRREAYPRPYGTKEGVEVSKVCC